MTAPARSRGRGQSGVLPWLVAPALVFYVGFAVIPVVGVLALSFTTWDGLGEIKPSGLTSWHAVLTDPGLPHALWVTFLVVAVSWAVQTPLSILVGTFIAGHQRYRNALAVLYIIPVLLSSAAIAIAYKALLDPNFGLGAGRIRQFFSITLPQLKYTIITSSTLMVAGSLTFFDLIFVLTEGGPGDATRVLAVDMYKRGFQANLMGPASAIAVILVLVGLAVALLLRRLGGQDPTQSQIEGV